VSIIRRVGDYLQEFEDDDLRALVAELVEIKYTHQNSSNRPMRQYREKIDAYASLIDDE
jgi:hypothetical protein